MTTPFYQLKQFIVTKIINAGIQAEYTADEQKKIHIINLTAFVGFTATLLFSILNIFLGFIELVVIDCIVAGIAALAFFFNSKGRHKACKIVTFIIMPIVIMIYPVFIGDIGTEYYNFLFLTIGFYVLDKKKHLTALTISISIIFICSKYCLANLSFPEKYKILETVHYYPCLVVSIGLTLMVVMLFKRDTLEYQQQISHQNTEQANKMHELAEKNKLADALLRELNHRVKNNLQLISSLFIMQSYKTHNEQIRQALSEARIRIDTVAIMHQRMYRDDACLASSLSSYISELTTYILQASGSDEYLNLHSNIEEMFLKTEDTLHIGLIVNELLTNAIKYGAPNDFDAENNLELIIYRQNNRVHISLQDSGDGFPDDFSIITANSFGMTLVGAIVTQHNGKLSITNRNGAFVSIDMEIDA